MIFFKSKISLLYFLIGFLICCTNSQFIYRQSDRAQILYVDIVSSSSTHAQQTINFPTPFQNTPKITYNILWINSNINGSVGFSLSTLQVSNTQVTVQIQANSGHTLFNVKIGILATDYPNSVQYNDTFGSQGSKQFTAPGNIIGYCAFISGYKGNIAFADMQFKFTSTISSDTINLYYSETLLGNMDSIDFNVLLIYQDPGFDSLLYQFQFTKSNEINIPVSPQSKSQQFSTQLSNNDNVFYGLNYWYDGSNLSFNFEVDQQNTSLINNSNVNLIIKSNKGYISWVSISVFQLIMRICPAGNFIIRVASDYQCVSNCSSINSQTYNDSQNTFPLQYNAYIMNPCSQCNSACYGCTGPNNNDCTSCASNLFYDSASKTCQSTQPAQTFCTQANIDLQTYQNCQSCYSTCQTCSGTQKDQCLTCMATYPYSYKGQCILGVQDGIYCDNTTFVCNDCNVTNCKSCDSSLQICQQCITGYYLYNNSCFSSIQNQTYCDTNNICYSCDLTKCVNCIHSADYCTSCQSNQYLLSNVCYNCDSSKCLTCQNTQDTCLSCQPYQYLFNNSCYNSNPDGAYCQLTNGLNYYTCQSCSQNCKICTGIGLNQCQQCFPSAYFYQNTCTLSQPLQTYCDNHLICYQCDSTCKYCNGPSNTECSQCFDGQYLDVKNGAQTCQICQKGCTLCSNSFNNCSACLSPYYLKGNSCVLNCLQNQYFDQSTRDCEQCSYQCLTCSDKSTTSCTSCIADAKLNENSQCVCSKQGYGFSSDGTQCIPCQLDRCQTCQISSICDSCIENSTLSTDSTGNQVCTCNEGYYYFKYYNKCIKCPQNHCQSCSVDGSTCTKCLPGFQLQNGSCSFCNNYKFADTNNQCSQNCSELCQVCSNSNVCSIYDINNPGYIPNQLCHFTCKQCSGLTGQDCLQCASDSREYNYLTQKCECKSGYIEINEPSCQKIEQVQTILQSAHQYLSIIGFPIISFGLILNVSPVVIYSYILQQLIGDISYVNYDQEQSINYILNFYTKYNLNNLYNLNKTNNNNLTNKDSDPSLKSQRLLHQNLRANQNSMIDFNIQQINESKRKLQNTQYQAGIVSYYETILDVKKQDRFFYSSIIPLSTIIIFFLIAAFIHLYEISKKRVLKFGIIFKWNLLILTTQINSNFLIFSLINIDLKQQQMIDYVCIGCFCFFYVSQLIWLFRVTRNLSHLDKSYSVISQYFERENFFGKYYFFILELKKIIFCCAIILTINLLRFTIWGLVALLIIETVLKKVYNPFNQSIDLYTTLFLDIAFILIITIFGVFLNSKDKAQLITYVTFILILLLIFSLISLILIIIKIIILIKNFKSQQNKEDKLNMSFQSNQTSSSKQINLQLQEIQASIRWQKNPIHNSRSRSSSTN
ncbi:hypothetical protein ABPG74_007679 [Tetrahymena malaccensis]